MFWEFGGANVDKDYIPIPILYTQQRQISDTIVNGQLQILNGRAILFGYGREVK